MCGLAEAAEAAAKAAVAAQKATAAKTMADKTTGKDKKVAMKRAAEAQKEADEAAKEAATLSGIVPGTDEADGTPNRACERLILSVFHHFFPRPVEPTGDASPGAGEDDAALANALQLTVDATNAKAAELVVKERTRGSFRCATEEDDDSQPLNVGPGAHAPAVRTRC